MIMLTINGTPCQAEAGDTILQAAVRHGIYIPTLCADERLKHFTSCFVCVVEVEGAPGFRTACSTEATDGMVVRTDSEAVRTARQWSLNLLLSNHYGDCVAPCQLECPAHVDIQGYIAEIANGQYDEAVAVVRETNPFPLATGKICTHPCETRCRRNLVEQPVAIKNLKRFAVDQVLDAGGEYLVPEIAAATGKRIAVVGGGPAGFTCAYFLRRQGHAVKVFEQMEAPGGMLRYGIPEYRLPKAQLDHEISQITCLGVETEYSRTLGKDLHLATLQAEFDAIFLGLGAWHGTPMKIDGEKGRDVFIGIDFLRSVIRGEEVPRKKSMIVVGGGNTAIDVVRTARRLGYDKVMLAYRRTEKEMPADHEEIEQAKEESIDFHFLTAPVRVERDTDGNVLGLVLQRMELGEPDASGRRRPVPVEGSDFLLEGEVVVSAIGQGADTTWVKDPEDPTAENITISRWGTVEVNDDYMTTVEGIFAGGDQVLGPKAAIDAIGQGKEAAYAIDRYLGGGGRDPFRNVNVRKEDFGELTKEMFTDYEEVPRTVMPVTEPVTRTDFNEVELGYLMDDGHNEASRCLECGCQAVFSCDLRRIATEVSARPGVFRGSVSRNRVDTSNPFITREMDKCILCGKCVRVCDEYLGVAALSFARRGFSSTVEPTLGRDLAASDCITCGVCAEICPTGALQFTAPLVKPGPLSVENYPSTCTLCAVGCRVFHEYNQGLHVGTAPARLQPSGRDLCGRGYFAIRQQREAAELENGNAADELIAAVKNVNGPVRVVVSPRISVEEGELVRRIFAEGLGVAELVVAGSAREAGVMAGLSLKERTLAMTELENAEQIVLCGRHWEERFPILPQKVIHRPYYLVGDGERLAPRAVQNWPATGGWLAGKESDDLARQLSAAGKPLFIVDVLDWSLEDLSAIRNFARSCMGEARFLTLGGNHLGLRLAGLGGSTKETTPVLGIAIGHLEGDTHFPAGIPVLTLGSDPLEESGTFVNLEGRLAQIGPVPEAEMLFEGLLACADAAGVEVPRSLEAVTQAVVQRVPGFAPVQELSLLEDGVFLKL